jgi:hypothetical protein
LIQWDIAIMEYGELVGEVLPGWHAFLDVGRGVVIFTTKCVQHVCHFLSSYTQHTKIIPVSEES